MDYSKMQPESLMMTYGYKPSLSFLGYNTGVIDTFFINDLVTTNVITFLYICGIIDDFKKHKPLSNNVL